jgi:hypothetical protein
MKFKNCILSIQKIQFRAPKYPFFNEELKGHFVDFQAILK